jgi:F0F1-type ATP synthase assembly protein I
LEGVLSEEACKGKDFSTHQKMWRKNIGGLTTVWKLLGIGWYIAFCLLAGAALGWWLDKKFGTGIILTLVCLTIGLVVALYGTYRMVHLLINQDKWKDKEKDK